MTKRELREAQIERAKNEDFAAQSAVDSALKRLNRALVALDNAEHAAQAREEK